MSTSPKEIFYDWMGGNEWLFRQINGIQPGVVYDQIMVAISKAADYHNFPYYMLALVAWVVGSYLWRKARHKGGSRFYLTGWVGVLLVLVLGFLIEGGTMKIIKETLSYPRPYIALQNVYVINDKADASADHHSFPSGHAAFITLLVVGMWPVLPTGMAVFGFFAILAVAWSRMALGMHFPADVLGGVTIVFAEIVILRAGLYKILHKMGIKC